MFYLHRNSLKQSTKQPFILFDQNLSKSSQDLLLQLSNTRERLLKQLQQDPKWLLSPKGNQLQRWQEDLQQILMQYLSLFRGFVISPLHDLAGLPETVLGQSGGHFIPSPLHRMYTFNWTDSISETLITITGDSFIEMASIIHNYGLWLMKCSSCITTPEQKPTSGLERQPTFQQATKYLQQAAGLFAFIREHLGQIGKDNTGQNNISGTDLDLNVIHAYEHQCLAEAEEFRFLNKLVPLEQKVMAKIKKQQPQPPIPSQNKSNSNKQKQNSLKSNQVNKSSGSKKVRTNSQSNKPVKTKSTKIGEQKHLEPGLLSELIQLSRNIWKQFRNAEQAIFVLPERRLKKWHTYLLIKSLLFRSWQMVLQIQLHYYQHQFSIQLKKCSSSSMSVSQRKQNDCPQWLMVDNCHQMIKRLCLKYNNYAKEFDGTTVGVTSEPRTKSAGSISQCVSSSWQNRTIDWRRLLKVIQNYIQSFRDESIAIIPFGIQSNFLMENLNASAFCSFKSMLSAKPFQLPRLHHNWTLNVSLELGVPIFLTNFDPFSVTNLGSELRISKQFIPQHWYRRFFHDLKQTETNLQENIEQSIQLMIKHPELRKVSQKLKQLRKMFLSILFSKVENGQLNNIDQIRQCKEKLIVNFQEYVSWLKGFMVDEKLRQIYGFVWTSITCSTGSSPSKICNSFCSAIFDVDYEICCNIYNTALWLMNLVQRISIRNEENLGEDVTSKRTSTELVEFFIETLREAAGMFHCLIDRSKGIKNLHEIDPDFQESLLKCFRNHCLAEAHEHLFRIMSNVNWIQLKILIHTMKLYWTLAEDLRKEICVDQNLSNISEQSSTLTNQKMESGLDSGNPNQHEQHKQWREYSQMKSYLYKTLSYFLLSEMYPNSGERTLATLQKCQTLLKFFRRQLSLALSVHQEQEGSTVKCNWLPSDDQMEKLQYFWNYLQQRYQQMCMMFVLNNHENYMKRFSKNLTLEHWLWSISNVQGSNTTNTMLHVMTTVDSIIYLQPIRFHIQTSITSPIDHNEEFWLNLASTLNRIISPNTDNIQTTEFSLRSSSKGNIKKSSTILLFNSNDNIKSNDNLQQISNKESIQIVKETFEKDMIKMADRQKSKIDWKFHWQTK